MRIGHSRILRAPYMRVVWTHKRKATSGGYKEKLKPEAILKLNARFSEVLDILGYPSPHYETNQRLPLIG